MKRLQSSFLLKFFSLILCCLFAGVLAASGVKAAYRNVGYTSPRELIRDQCSSQAYGAMNAYIFSTADLTPEGKESLKNYQEWIDPEKTNFRYIIQNEKGEVLADNLGGKSIEEFDDIVGDESYCWTYHPGEYGLFDWISIENYMEENGLDWDEFEVTSNNGETYTIKYDSKTYTFREGYYYNPQYFAGEDTKTFPGKYVEDFELTVTCGVAKNPVVEDIYVTYPKQWEDGMKSLKQLVPWVAASGVGTLLTGLVFLWCCGHKRGEEGIYLCWLHRMPYELLAALDASLCGLAACIPVAFYEGYWFSSMFDTPELADMATWRLVGISVSVLMLLAAPIASGFVTQIKARQLWKRSLTGKLLGWCWRVCKKCAGLLWEFIQNIRLFWKAMLAVAFLLFWVSMLCILGYESEGFTVFIAFLLCVGALILLGRWLRGWQRVNEGLVHISGGNLEYQIDTNGLPRDLVRQAHALNTLSEGMEKAVNEQMKSERFRTELITNVSHDLKTPLTSIINYVDLLKKENITDQPAADYIDVLDRKSQRLKALTEDLVEASKAAAGVLSVEMTPLDVNQMVQQTVGEYEERLAASQLSLVSAYLPKSAFIKADGRHLWRVMDNLLNNCCKYAMPGTRVYLDMTDRGACVDISIKNVSADPLNIPPEELMERFVRGDESRTAEGSGLGLSIAQSLCALMDAEFRIDTDGDLFKATVTFKKL